MLRHKWGYDVDAVFGWDFGMFRLEGELGYKRAKLKSATLDSGALGAILQPTTTTTFAADGHSSVLSGMVNGLVDPGASDGVNGSLGVGAGIARAKYNVGLFPPNALNFIGEARAFAWQALAEVRVPLSANIDAGLKYRYFQTARLNFGPFCVTTCSTVLPYHLHGKYRSNSLLASLVYNFYSPPPPPPRPPPPAQRGERGF